MVARFCPDCGASLEERTVEDRPRKYCLACDRVHYEQLKVGAGALIEEGGRLLLLQRSHEPFKLQWNLPAGYVEVDESPVTAAVREVREETGLDVDVERLEGVYFFDDDPRGNGILIVYRCRAVGGRLTDSPEGDNAMYVSATQIPNPLAGGGHADAIGAWQERAAHRSEQ